MPFLKVPFALDAAVLVVNIPDVFEIYLSAPTIQGIFLGAITNWNDPLVLADNEGLDHTRPKNRASKRSHSGRKKQPFLLD